MPPTAPPSVLYCTRADLDALLSQPGTDATVDDDRNMALSAAELLYLNTAIYWGTDRVNLYCLSRYPANTLAQSWLVNNWAVICAASWMSKRRGNPPSASVADLYKEAIMDMKLIQNGQFQIPNCGERDSAWPAWSNVRVDILYPLRKIRVEYPLSEQTPTVIYPQIIDQSAQFINDQI